MSQPNFEQNAASSSFEPAASSFEPAAFEPSHGPNGVPGPSWDPAAPVLEEVREPRRPLLTAVQAIAVLLAVSALGYPLGVLWQAVAPNIPVLVVTDGAVYDDTQPEQFMGGDGWFVLLGLGFGILVAVLVWFTCRQLRGPVGLAVLAIGCTVAGVLAWKVGREIGVSQYLAGLHTAPPGTHLSKPNDVRIEAFQWWPPKLEGVLLIPAFGAVLGLTILAAWSSFANLRAEPAMAPAASSADSSDAPSDASSDSGEGPSGEDGPEGPRPNGAPN